MAFVPKSLENVGLYVPSTNVWDVGRLYEIEVTDPEFKELLVRLYQNINNISIALNLKDSGYYIDQEFVNGQQWFDPTPNVTAMYRTNFRKVVIFGALPVAGAKSVAHGITVDANTTWTRIYGAATDPVNLLGIPIDRSSPTLNENIKIEVDATNVTITTAIDYSAFTICNIVVEYLNN